ncbi:protein VAC14 homolog [Vigna umbellata]|uniref:protein VAC14 homolog n=1 Tax=Vigna umbellata TaxID=87088 RepID=UPI001F5F55E2|nr:protein VAC14 homolog [Vigna umbellata]
MRERDLIHTEMYWKQGFLIEMPNMCFEVVLLVLDVHACIAKDPRHFRRLVVFLMQNFLVDNSLLEKLRESTVNFTLY